MTALPSAWALRPCPGCARWATCRQTDEGPRCLVCVPAIALTPIAQVPDLTPHEAHVETCRIESILATLPRDWRDARDDWADRRARGDSERRQLRHDLHEALCELAGYQGGHRAA